MNAAIELRPVLFVIGLLLTTLGLAMVVPAAVDLGVGNSDWQVFAASSAVTVFFGVSMALANRLPGAVQLGLRQAFFLTAASWLAVVAFAALPFKFSGFGLDYADAFFEAMSGLTTTGSTVLVGLDSAPPGILLWRALLQWLGGIGIIVMAVALLPFLRVGGMQLFQMESSDTSEKSLPRVAKIATWITWVYVGMTVACTWALWLFGMTGLEAVAHAMTAVSTGGFSTSDASIGHFREPMIHWTIMVFMVAGSIPFVLYVRTMLGQRKAILLDSQVRSFFGFVVAAALSVSVWLWVIEDIPIGDSIRLSFFNVISVITTTGFASADYSLWGALPVGTFFLLTFVGGCTGSTAGGIKIFRFEVIWEAIKVHAWRLVFRHGVRTPTYARRPLGDEVFFGVLLFVLVFLALTAFFTMLLAGMGLDLVTAVTGAATALANVGPGLGPIIGPAGNFAALPDAAKWALAFAMLLGRLEIFTVMVLFAPAFWRA